MGDNMLLSAYKPQFPRILDKVIDRFRPAAARDATGTEFRNNGVLTLGVELELQIIDAASGALAPKADELLKALKPESKVKPELYRDMIELNTSVCGDANEVAADLAATLDRMIAEGEKIGITFASTGSHPVSGYSDSDIYPAERYNDLIDRNQWLTRRWKVYGLHVHIGMESGDECIRFNNFFMRLLPHLLALSSSAPFWQNQDTGLATCRPTTYEALPTAGLPYFVHSWSEFEALCATLRKAKAISSLKDLWWDVRPSPGFGTLEIRVCDSPATLAETVAIVAFIHALGPLVPRSRRLAPPGAAARALADAREQMARHPPWARCQSGDECRRRQQADPRRHPGLDRQGRPLCHTTRIHDLHGHAPRHRGPGQQLVAPARRLRENQVAAGCRQLQHAGVQDARSPVG